MRKLITITVLMVLTMLALSAERHTSYDVWKELSAVRKSVSYIEKRDNLDTEATRKVKALEKEYEELKARENAEREALNARVEASKLKIAEYRAQNAYRDAWLHTMAAKRYFDLIHGEGKWATNIDYNKIVEEEAAKAQAGRK